MNFKLTGKTFFRNNTNLCFVTVLAVTGLIFTYKSQNGTSLLFYILLFYYLIGLIPSLFLLFEHYNHCKNLIVTVNNDSLRISKNNQVQVIENIVKVRLLISRQKIENNYMIFFPFESYSILAIETEQKVYFISSFLEYDLSNISNKLSCKNKEIEKAIFPSIIFWKWRYKVANNN